MNSTYTFTRFASDNYDWIDSIFYDGTNSKGGTGHLMKDSKRSKARKKRKKNKRR